MATPRARALTEAALRRWPLPALGADADKESRGHVLVVAGSREIPGAALLAATAALRAGAGKLTIAAPEPVAAGLALAIPEARVIALAETRAGGFHASGCEALAPIAEGVSALVMGPGMLDEARSVLFVRELLPLFRHSTLVLDALAMSVVHEGAFAQPVVLTPHAGEMAHLSGLAKEVLCGEPLAVAREAARRWNACVALKGAVTHIAEADGAAWRFDGGGPGLATSGSGDTLAGLIGGFAARGLPPLQACAWGVLMHARAGAVLARHYGPMGYLARELSAQVPALMHALERRR
ncbi:NAD(P)H-hydrate dehydratase [Variovorax saccharolyticus]|uniref:NAD(P)H-hydrate dehydratase n=1 Tax=Variovorax saccharolyticus TaxID=3053516 RepID=UPI0025783978|nr:NAD(P)H-hydrate dehydratase [Variovorax sp. J31P216]MDM0023636.1 NAD(P)H-hydrate dehydratase [Variovorax sp. J31P216]